MKKDVHAILDNIVIKNEQEASMKGKSGTTNEKMKGFILGIVVMSLIFMTSISTYALVESKTIIASYNNLKIYIDEKLMTPKDVNGNVAEPFIYNGTTYIPIRAVGEAFGKSVSWDGSTSSVYVGTQPAVVYQNSEYGFRFQLPDSWRNFAIVDNQWKGTAVEGPQAGDVIATGPLISIRHPLWTEKIPRQDIPIMVFTTAQWSAIQLEKLSLGAAPIGPSELGHNNKYVFALPARYNYAFPLGFEEVEQILKDNPLQQ